MRSALILSLVCWLVPAEHQTHNDETVDHAVERYATIADAVHEVAGADERLVLFMLTVGKHESHFRRVIHSGAERGDHGRSWGMFQKWIGRSRDARIPGTPYRARDIVGVDADSTRRAVEVAAADLAPCIERAGGRPMGVFKCYGGVGAHPDEVTLKRLQARVATFNKLSIKLAVERRKEESPAAE